MNRRTFLKYSSSAVALTFFGLELKIANGMLNSTSEFDKYIYLTIDDGPMEPMRIMLKDMEVYDAKTTFFCVGRLLKTNKGKDLAYEAIEKGHVIANHSYNHPNFCNISKLEAISEVERTHELIMDILNHIGINQEEHGLYFRFPYGARSKSICDKLKELGYDDKDYLRDSNDWLRELGYNKDYLWDVDSNDWLYYRGRLMEIIIKDSLKGQDGDIILCHDIPFSAKKLIKPILEHYHSKGFKFENLKHYERQLETLKNPHFQSIST